MGRDFLKTFNLEYFTWQVVLDKDYQLDAKTPPRFTDSISTPVENNSFGYFRENGKKGLSTCSLIVAVVLYATLRSLRHRPDYFCLKYTYTECISCAKKPLKLRKTVRKVKTKDARQYNLLPYTTFPRLLHVENLNKTLNQMREGTPERLGATSIVFQNRIWLMNGIIGLISTKTCPEHDYS